MGTSYYLKKYRVRFEFHSVITHEVEAKNEAEAIAISREWNDPNLLACNSETVEETAREL